MVPGADRLSARRAPTYRCAGVRPLPGTRENSRQPTTHPAPVKAPVGADVVNYRLNRTLAQRARRKCIREALAPWASAATTQHTRPSRKTAPVYVYDARRPQGAAQLQTNPIDHTVDNDRGVAPCDPPVRPRFGVRECLLSRCPRAAARSHDTVGRKGAYTAGYSRSRTSGSSAPAQRGPSPRSQTGRCCSVPLREAESPGARLCPLRDCCPPRVLLPCVWTRLEGFGEPWRLRLPARRPCRQRLALVAGWQHPRCQGKHRASPC